MSTPQHNLAAEQADHLRTLAAGLADALAGRTFSPRLKLLDLHAVARATTLSERTIERLAAEGRFPKPQDGIGKRMWRESSLIAWMDRNDPNLATAEKGD